MTTKINGTNTAASPAITGADTDTGLSFGTDTVNINTGGTTRATVDSSGALDVPTNFPIKINGSEKLKIESTGNLQIARDNYIGTVASGQSIINIGSSGGSQIGFHQVSTNNDDIRFYTHTSGSSHAERMRITSGGSLCVGVDTTANSEKLRVDSTGSTGTVFLRHGSTDNVSIMEMRHSRNTGSSSAAYLKFQDSGGTVRGSIKASPSGTTYFTTSDYRLKENVTALSDGITRLKTLKPSKFNFIGNSKIVDGFLAHEVTAVPEAISGTKDEVDSDNNPVYQEIDQSKLVPLLTAALQEAVAKIEVLETKVAALEAG